MRLNIQAALLQGTKLLEDGHIPAPRLTSEVLLAHAIGCERPFLYAHADRELREVEWIHYGRYLHERLKGKPTQYITKRQEFYGRMFRVTPDVLIPRPETEHVIEALLRHARGAQRIVDVGSGSGAIAVTAALEMNAEVFATDISKAALSVAALNARALQADVRFVTCNLLSAIGTASVDAVVSNPPYVPRAQRDGLQREVRDWEPEIALYGGDTGFEIYERLIPESARVLEPGGWLILELGFGMQETVSAFARNSFESPTIIADLAGIPRVFTSQKVKA